MAEPAQALKLKGISWTLINWETENMSLIFHFHCLFTELLNWRLFYKFCTHPAFPYGLITLFCFGPIWHRQACYDSTPGSLWECGNVGKEKKGRINATCEGLLQAPIFILSVCQCLLSGRETTHK